MGIKDTKNGKLIYHLTKLSNLESICKHGLLPRKVIIDSNLGFSDIADKEIITKRTSLGLDAYTPFHFHPYSAFDVAVKNAHKDEIFIYICLSRNYAQNKNFKVLPRHPLNIEECVIMNYDDGFNEIDWDTMQSLGCTDNYVKQVKMAECLTEFKIPVGDFQCIYVKDDETKKVVEDILKKNNITEKPPYVDIMPWL